MLGRRRGTQLPWKLRHTHLQGYPEHPSPSTYLLHLTCLRFAGEVGAWVGMQNDDDVIIFEACLVMQDALYGNRGQLSSLPLGQQQP